MPFNVAEFESIVSTRISRTAYVPFVGFGEKPVRTTWSNALGSSAETPRRRTDPYALTLVHVSLWRSQALKLTMSDPDNIMMPGDIPAQSPFPQAFADGDRLSNLIANLNNVGTVRMRGPTCS